MKFSRFSLLTQIALVALALPMLGLSATVEVSSPTFSSLVPSNVTCVQTSCPDSLAFGQSSVGSFGPSLLTLADGDTYKITASYSNAYTAKGTSFFFDPVITYTGAATLTHTDTITISMLQNYVGPAPPPSGNWDSKYTEAFPFTLPATDASASGNSSYSTYSYLGGTLEDTIALPTLTSSGPSSYTTPTALSPLDGNLLALTAQTTFVFDPGTITGASGSSPMLTSSVPEPAQSIPAGVGLVGLFLLRVRQLRSKKA